MLMYSVTNGEEGVSGSPSFFKTGFSLLHSLRCPSSWKTMQRAPGRGSPAWRGTYVVRTGRFIIMDLPYTQREAHKNRTNNSLLRSGLLFFWVVVVGVVVVAMVSRPNDNRHPKFDSEWGEEEERLKCVSGQTHEALNFNRPSRTLAMSKKKWGEGRVCKGHDEIAPPGTAAHHVGFFFCSPDINFNDAYAQQIS